MKTPLFRLVSHCAILLAVAAGPGCRHDAVPGATPPAAETVLVFAAASTTDVMEEIKAACPDGGVQVQSNYASSATLSQQILHGADADIFISADERSAEMLAKQSLVAKTESLLGNRLVVIVPNESRLEIRRPADLAGAKYDHLALGDPDSVPAGQYAKKAFVKLGLWEQLRPKVAVAGDVRQALTFVETGAAEAGVVYATDAAVSKKVRVACVLPEDLTGPVRYPFVLLKNGEHRAAAESFYRFLLSPQAAAIFQKHGFTVLESHRK